MSSFSLAVVNAGFKLGSGLREGVRASCHGPGGTMHVPGFGSGMGSIFPLDGDSRAGEKLPAGLQVVHDA